MDPLPRPPATPRSDERGMALAMALFAILVIGAMVTGLIFAGRMEMIAGRNSVYTAQATEAAEKGLADAFSSWNSAWNAYAVGVDNPQPVQVISGATNVRYANSVRRLQGGLYLITSVGEKLDQGGNVVASRQLVRMGKLVSSSVDVKAAITSKESPSIFGNITITGVNTTPPGWTPCPGPDLAAVRSDQAVTKGGSAAWYGTPSPPIIQNDASLTAATFTGPFNTLAQVTTMSFPSSSGPTLTGLAPSITGSPSRCDRTNTNNWGEPNRGGGAVVQCQSYFPVIHFSNALGNANKVHITGGRGQGIILVDGDIQLDGGLEFYGLVIALGNVDVQGNGTKVTGAILAQSVGAGTNSFSGTSLISYSQCAVQFAITGATPVIAINERSWAQVNPR